METAVKFIHEKSGAIDILLAKLAEMRERNPQVSLRAFAQKLGMSSGALSEILAGKRPLSNSVKRRIAAKLCLSPKESMAFFQEDLPEKMSLGPDDRLTLSQDQFHLISDWWYFGLLNLLKTRDFKNNLGWMARRLGITLSAATEAWERLFRLGFLEMKGRRVTRRFTNLKTTDQLADLSIRKSHLADLALIEKSLLNLPVSVRDNTSTTFVIDRNDLPRAMEFIRVFQEQFLKQFGKECGDEVYKMSIALYPLTNVSGEESCQ